MVSTLAEQKVAQLAASMAKRLAEKWAAHLAVQ
jgi:hypothetical protein